MKALSDRCRAHVRALFAKADWGEAERLLEAECGDNLPLMGGTTSAGLDRVRFAALRLSTGRLDSLREAVQLAKADWRDLLVAAGFADDAKAHEHWQP